MRVAEIVPSSAIYGVGNRFVIWVQGCSLRCVGCWNTAMWEFGLGDDLSVDTLLQSITNTTDIEGVTILGGEPFDQYVDLLLLAKNIKAAGLTLMLYTGYELSELHAKAQTEILAYTDILITGRYVQSQRNTNLQWIGSENQSIHFLTAAYRDYKLQDSNYVEIHIDEFGKIQMLGFPNLKDWKHILK
jgi:anaerobic ribonucleoside-triphosphate reductase activating protein